MEYIAPVPTGIFPRQRHTARGRGSVASVHQDPEAVQEMEESIDLRPSRPLANIPLLLEILSKTGTPANAGAAKIIPLRRRSEDRNGLGDPAQYDMGFEEDRDL